MEERGGEVGGLDVQTPRREALQLGVHLAFTPVGRGRTKTLVMRPGSRASRCA